MAIKKKAPKPKTNKDLKAFYDGVYAGGESKHYTKLLFADTKVTLEKIGILDELNWKGKTVLDVGCGTGELAYHIAGRGAKKVVGIDFSPEAIKVAKHLYNRPNLSFDCVDVHAMKGSFDVVLAVGTLEHADDPFRMLSLFKKLVRKGGSIIVTSPNWLNPRGYILMTLRLLFDAPITLADLHYLTPVEYEAWATRLGMELSWKTIDQSWSLGNRLLQDLERRIPNVLCDAGLPRDPARIQKFIRWVEEHIVTVEREQPHTGATGLYHFKKAAR
ncbi:MAG: class I SAM-dependent methyltransferase [Candidatus Vogelbacteria bacterium]|nr:class I SAM-dependent methyltransferase [Candidatus Vogelbacteria bacterium]